MNFIIIFIVKNIRPPASTSFKNKDEKLIINFAWPNVQVLLTQGVDLDCGGVVYKIVRRCANVTNLLCYFIMYDEDYGIVVETVGIL